MSPFDYKCQLSKVGRNTRSLISHPDTPVYLLMSRLVITNGGLPFSVEQIMSKQSYYYAYAWSLQMNAMVRDCIYLC